MSNLQQYIKLEQVMIGLDYKKKKLFDERHEAVLSMRLALQNKDMEAYKRHKKNVKDIDDKLRHLGLRIRNVQNM